MGQAIQHILVTTDLSEESTRAFPTAVQFASALGARITVLYVLPAMDVNPISSPFVSPIRPPSDEELLRLADADLQALRPKFPGVKLEFASRVASDIAAEVERFAAGSGADLIVLASHGRTGLRRIVMGSIAEQILRHATRPVLIVPLR
ncbi:MAG: universal stress protein [Planctomycetes bacterium]|nr:universal stress protein [Planctomycetota bacterium]